MSERLDRAAVEAAVARWHRALRDLRVSIEDAIEQADRVAVRLTWRGIRVETRGIAALEREVTWATLEIYRLADRRIVETWSSVAMFASH